jgi:hypothetical protein
MLGIMVNAARISDPEIGGHGDKAKRKGEYFSPYLRFSPSPCRPITSYRGASTQLLVMADPWHYKISPLGAA